MTTLQKMRARDDMSALRMELELEKNIDINSTNAHGKTRLLCALEEHYRSQSRIFFWKKGVTFDKIRLLLKYNPDTNQADHQGNLPLHIAILQKDHTIIEWLLAKGADLNALGYLPYHIGEGKNLTNTQVTPLHCALLANDSWTIKYLLKHGANIDGKDSIGRTPLLFAIESLPTSSGVCAQKIFVETKIIDHFLSHNPDINQGVIDKNISESLLLQPKEKEQLFSEKNNSPLCIAIEKGAVHIASALLQKGADPKVFFSKSPSVWVTPLHQAIEQYRSSNQKKLYRYLINLLIKKGINVNQTDTFGKTPLDTVYSCDSLGQSKLIRLLISADAERSSDEKKHIAVKNKVN